MAGGFKQYLAAPVGDIAATSQAIELMEIYGVPDDLDLNWVRSFLRPSLIRQSEKWMVAATRERLNHLPGLAPPSWLDFVYYERSLLAAAVLVGLCFFATLSSPKPKAVEPTEGPSPPNSDDVAAGQAG